ncbi:N-acetyl sugar amidotransferase [Candidatus Peregrinibacteria bacterium]|nr:N-acetyl sugar amidotransferase [Candidatus Peregrinibacteria bacterium]
MTEKIISDPKLLRRCSRCVMPETQESIVFDEAGVCSTCRNLEIKEKLNWINKGREFVDLLENYRGKYFYDCIIPFSGGEDSTFTVLALVKKFGLRPLVVSYDHHMYRPTVLRNAERTIKRLGVDFFKFSTNWQLVKKLMRVSLERKGDIYWYQHSGIFAFPMHVAVKFNVPLVIWGEPSSEYTSYYGYDETEEVDERRFNMFVNLGITAEDMIGFLNDNMITMNDLQFHAFPSRDKLKAINCRSICLGSYESWDVKKQVEIIKSELDWECDFVEGVPPEYNYEKIEDMMQGVQDYLKFIKRGYGRMSHLASIDIRNGRLKREEALNLLEKWEGLRPASLDVFLYWLNISEKEFNDIASRHAVKPWKHDFNKTKRGEELPDQKFWSRD